MCTSPTKSNHKRLEDGLTRTHAERANYTLCRPIALEVLKYANCAGVKCCINVCQLPVGCS